MRITENSNYETIRNTLSRSREKLGDLQNQSGTLKKLNQPSDDPVGAAKVLELRSDKANNDQFQMNSKLAQTYLNNTDHALGDFTELLLRLKELAINQSSSVNSSEETRQSVAEEVGQLAQQAIATANRKVGDRYLFGGYQTQRPPIDSDGGYHGDDGQMMVEISSDVFISTNLPGWEVFNTHPQIFQAAPGDYSENMTLREEEHQPNVNLFSEIQNFKTALLTGDLDSIRATLDGFDQLHSKVVSVRAKLGARLQGLDSANRAIERHNLTNASLSSAIEDADMAQVMSELGKEETVFKSALASSKRLIQPTLLDFLR